jgi:hypothetical protein
MVGRIASSLLIAVSSLRCYQLHTHCIMAFGGVQESMQWRAMRLRFGILVRLVRLMP